MDKQLLDLITRLSQRDKKTLCQKALKASEEVGELAKKVLPFEDAFACQHRFVERTSILEEVADVILTVESIAFDLGFTQEEINDMLLKKALYWAELQARDTNAKFPIPFEIHLTVAEGELEYFKNTCFALDVKPVLLDLHGNDGDVVMKDLMTSSVHIGSNASALAEMRYHKSLLTAAGFKVIREKIETVPWHPAAPSQKHANPVMPANCYFECHLAVIATDETLPKLREVSQKHDCHLSRNIFKRLTDTEFKIMLTYRVYSGVIESFKDKIEIIKNDLTANGFPVDKTIVEFSIFDSKIDHDAEWMKVHDPEWLNGNL